MANNTTVDGLLDLHASGSFVVMSNTFDDGKIVWDHSEQAARGVADSHRISDSVRNRVIEALEMGPRISSSEKDMLETMSIAGSSRTMDPTEPASSGKSCSYNREF